MKKILSISLYVIIFLLVALINVISIKKFFDNKKSIRIDNIIAVNIITDLVSYNKIEVEEINEANINDIESNEVVEEIKKFEDTKEVIEENQEAEKEIVKETIVEDNTLVEESNSLILFDGLNEEELILKLEKNLKNELSGTGKNFVDFYKTTGLDPYLAVAIVLHETGCSWNCSNLVKECFNYGGLKGGEVKYKDTRYTCYSSKEEGINAYLNMLYNNYYSIGLTTPELINPKYAANLEWSVKINNYIEKIKNS